MGLCILIIKLELTSDDEIGVCFVEHNKGVSSGEEMAVDYQYY